MRIGEVEITVPEYQDSIQDDARRRLSALVGSFEGTYPMNRSFGIDAEILDLPMPAAKAMLAAEIYDKAEQYLPDISVTDIEFREIPGDGVLAPLIFCEPAEGEEDFPEGDTAESEEDEYESD